MNITDKIKGKSVKEAITFLKTLDQNARLDIFWSSQRIEARPSITKPKPKPWEEPISPGIPDEVVRKRIQDICGCKRTYVHENDPRLNKRDPNDPVCNCISVCNMARIDLWTEKNGGETDRTHYHNKTVPSYRLV